MSRVSHSRSGTERASAEFSIDAVAWLVLSVPVRIALGLVFALSSYMKLRPAAGPLGLSGPQDFSGAVKAFKVLGENEFMIRLTVGVVPWTEAICALLLVVGLCTRAAALIVTCLLTLFTGLVVMALLRDLNIHCGCFGDKGLICPTAMGWCKVFENGLLLAAAGALALTPRHPLSLDSLRGR